MKWNINFDLVAFSMILMIFIIYSSYKQISTRSKRLYKSLLLVALASTITDIMSAVAASYITNPYTFLSYATHIIHFLVQGLVPCMYCIFTYSMIYETGRLTLKRRLVIILPYSITMLLVLTTPVTNFAFKFDEQGNYLRGWGQIGTYGCAAFYIFTSCIIIMKNLRVITRLQKIAALFYTIECFTLSAVQVFRSYYLLQEIAIAFAMLFTYLTMQNPLEYVDIDMKTYNRSLFMKIVNNFIANRETFSIICTQIEGLHYINEKFGMENGTDLLAEVPEFLSENYASNNIFRIGPTRFAVLLPGEKDYMELNEKVIERFGRPFKINNIDVKLQVYLNCISYPRHGTSLSDILDIISYSLKDVYGTKKNSIVVGNKELFSKMHRQMNVEQAVSNAVENRSFEVFYQPIFNITAKAYTSMEALIRINDPSLGYISPEEFIPMAEKNGDILPIGEIVLEKVCRFIKSNHPEEYGIDTIHVNLSVVQCMQENISEKLLSIIDRYEIPHRIIDFEITETAAVNSGEQLNILMKKLNKRGIQFALDDYGTGYSNQASIMEFPYSTVKLDKSIIWASQTSEKAAVSLKHTIAMLKELKMSVLAEGVETEAQIKYLTGMGCEFFQGYFYSTPVSETEILSILKNNITKTGTAD